MLKRISLSIGSLILGAVIFMLAFQMVQPVRADSGSREVICTATISPGGIATLTTFTSAAIACPQTHMGDFLMVSALTTDPGSVSVTAKVVATGSIKVVFANTTAGTITPASDTYSVAVFPRYVSP